MATTKGEEMKPLAKLIVRSGQKAGLEIPLDSGGVMVIGRDPTATFQILDELMSRAHSRIDFQASTYYLVDLKSSNGTFVNGKRIERAALKTGDSILLGKTRLEFVSAGGQTRQLERRSEGIELVDDEPISGSTSVIKRVALGDLRRGGQDASARAADRALEAIYEVGNLINAESDLDKVLDAIMDSVQATFKVERAVLFLEENGELVSRIMRHHGKKQAEGRVSRTVVEQCRNEEVSILSSDAMLDDRFKSGDSILLERIRSIMCVPLATKRTILGVLYVDNRGMGGAYHERDLELLAAIGNQAGIAIERAMLHEETKKRLTSAVSALIGAFEAGSPASVGHSQRVASVAVQIARQMGLDDETVEKARLTGFLHDVGKAVVPRALLERAGALSEAERETVKGHSVAGARIAASIHGLGDVVEGVRAHHERWDGAGYPEGLAGDSIPLLARIVAVADAYDAMAMGQPWRKAFSGQAILTELENASGAQFDPEACKALMALLVRKALVIADPSFTIEALLP